MIKKQMWYMSLGALLALDVQAGGGLSKPSSADAQDAAKVVAISAVVYGGLRVTELGVRSMLARQRRAEKQKSHQQETENQQPKQATALSPYENDMPTLMRRANIILVHAQGQEARIQALEDAREKHEGENSLLERLRRCTETLKQQQQLLAQEHANTKESLEACRQDINEEVGRRESSIRAAQTAFVLNTEMHRSTGHLNGFEEHDILSSASSSSSLVSSSAAVSHDMQAHQELNVALMRKCTSLLRELRTSKSRKRLHKKPRRKGQKSTNVS